MSYYDCPNYAAAGKGPIERKQHGGVAVTPLLDGFLPEKMGLQRVLLDIQMKTDDHFQAAARVFPRFLGLHRPDWCFGRRFRIL